MTVHHHEFETYDQRGRRTATLTTWARCSCGLGLRQRYLTGKLYEVRVQVVRLGDWVDPRVLLTTSLPFRLCPACDGDGCAKCRQLGVVYA